MTTPATNLNYTERLFSAVMGPQSNRIAVVSISDTSSSTDLSDAAQLGSIILQGHYVNIISSVDCYLMFSPDGSETADPEEDGSGTPANRCDWIPAGYKESFVIPPDCPHFVRVGSGSGIVRISLSSRPWPEWYRWRSPTP